MGTFRFAVTAFGVSIAFTGFSLCGQEAQQASITGFVLDSSQAAVAQGRVNIVSQTTQFHRVVRTETSGAYAVVGLAPGDYKVLIQAPGFKVYEQTGVHVDAGSVAKVNVVLEVGSTSETVNVVESEPLLQTEKAEVSTLVSGAQVSELPLNGRNFTQLLALGAGVVSQQTGHQMGLGQEGNPLMSVSGGRISMNKFTFDGVLAMDTGGNRGLDIFPRMEAIQETVVQKSNYSADQGGFGYGIVNLITRSGTQEFHGGLYEYFRSDAMDARNFFSSTRQVIRLNNFGFTLGGPIYIPGHYNSDKTKDFFFYSESWSRRVGPQITSFTSPPQEVFTSLVPTAQMRAGNFSALSTQLKNPAGGVFPNNQVPASSIDPNALLLINTFYPLPNRSGSPNYAYDTSSFTRYREELVRWDHNFNSKWMWTTRYVQDTYSQDQDIARPSSTTLPTFPDDFAKPGKNLVSKLSTIFSPSVVNLFTFGYSYNRMTNEPLGGERPAGLTIPQAYPSNYFNLIPDITLGGGYASLGLGTLNLNENPVYTWKDDLSFQIGRHSLKAGIESIHLRKIDHQHTNEQGAFTFDSSFTGNAIADLLTGHSYSYTENNTDPGVSVHSWDNELYIQDDFKVSPNLTINGGLRWFLIRGGNGGAAENNLISTFVPSLYNPAQAPVLNPNGSIVPGTGNSINGIITPTDLQGLNLPASLKKPVNDALGPRFGIAWTPFGGKTVIRSGYGVNYFWGTNSNDGREVNPPFVQSVSIQNTTLSNPLGVAGALFPPSVNAMEIYPKQPTVQSWNVTVQRGIGGGWTAEIGYVGTRGTHLPRTIQLNQSFYGPGNVNLRRPYLGYGSITYNENTASSRYNALVASARRAFANGLLVQLAYTYSKSLADAEGTPLDSRNLRLDWGLSDLDRTHVFTGNFVWDVPFLKTRRDWRTALIRNWQVNGIVTLQSGLPVNITQSGDVAGFGTGTGSQRPYEIASPYGGFSQSVSEWFNVNAFQAVSTPGAVGSAPYNAVRGPGIVNLDSSLFRNVAFTEKWKAQFGVEMFNTLNHTQFEGLGSVIGSSTFGQVTSARDPRLVQLRAKVMF